MLEVSEKLIQKSILDYLRIKGYLCKRNNAGRAFYEYKGKKSSFSVGESGWPDVEGITKDGKYFGIEVKARRGVLSDNQIRIGGEITKNNGIWFVARSLDDVIAKGF
jgi:hypothetical protein